MFRCQNIPLPPEPRLTPLGGGWELSFAGESFGVFSERQAMGLARRLSDGSLSPDDVRRARHYTQHHVIGGKK